MGAIPEELPGATKSVVCVESSVRTLGDPGGAGPRQGGHPEQGRRWLPGSQLSPEDAEAVAPCTGGRG